MEEIIKDENRQENKADFKQTKQENQENTGSTEQSQSTKSKLITEGIYKYSRNPAFVGFYLMFIGLFLVYTDIITCISMLLDIYAMNKLVIEEEKHLEEVFGEEYTNYKKKAPRYLFW